LDLLSLVDRETRMAGTTGQRWRRRGAGPGVTKGTHASGKVALQVAEDGSRGGTSRPSPGPEEAEELRSKERLARLIASDPVARGRSQEIGPADDPAPPIGRRIGPTEVRRAAETLALALAGDTARLRATLAAPAGGGPALDGPPGPPEGVTPLMAAAAGGHEAMVELLLARGADPACRDARGRSAAAHARASGHPHLAERLDTVVDQERTMR
jgi:hypothetical protein